MADTPPRLLIGTDGKYGGSSSTYVRLGVVLEEFAIVSTEALDLTFPACPSTITHPLHATIERAGRGAGLLGACFTPDAEGCTFALRVKVGGPRDRHGSGALSYTDADAALAGLAEAASGPAPFMLGAGSLELGWAATHDVDSSSFGFRDLARKLVPLLSLPPAASANEVWGAWELQSEGIRLMRVLDYLDMLRRTHPETCCFNVGATASQIVELETVLNLTLPTLLRVSLMRLNGGAFRPAAGAHAHTSDGRAAFQLLSTAEIQLAYYDLVARQQRHALVSDWGGDRPIRPRFRMQDGSEMPWPHLPIARQLDEHEYLVLEAYGGKYLSRVTEAPDARTPREWAVRYGSYTEFFEKFVGGAGLLKTAA